MATPHPNQALVAGRKRYPTPYTASRYWFADAPSFFRKRWTCIDLAVAQDSPRISRTRSAMAVDENGFWIMPSPRPGPTSIESSVYPDM